MKKITPILFFFGATPLMAGTFAPPQGCQAFLTVQSHQCVVSTYYRCATNPEGDQWRADFDENGLFYQSRINHETEWVESIETDTGIRQVLDPNPLDPASFTDLLATGRDDFIFGLTKDNGEQSEIRGFDKMTGETVVIDGISLMQTEFAYTETDPEGNILAQARGHEFVSPEYRNFFAGPSEWFSEGQWLPMDGSPIQFILPGEKGFAATIPIFDCDEVMSGTLPGGGQG